MNLNNIDSAALKKIADMLSSAQGNELKQKLNGIDKEALVKKFSQLNISPESIADITEKIQKLSKEDMMNIISKMKGE